MPGESARQNGKKGGRPKGSKTKATLDKEAAREFVRQRVIANLAPMIDAQLTHATGIKYLVVRAKKGGKFLRVTEGMAKQRQDLTDDEEIIEVWEKDPSVQAFTDLLNRALDKPAEQVQKIEVVAELTIVNRLHAARKRLAR